MRKSAKVPEVPEDSILAAWVGVSIIWSSSGGSILNRQTFKALPAYNQPSNEVN